MMKNLKKKNAVMIFSVVLFVLGLCSVLTVASGVKNYKNSLHKSGAGMKHWYETKGGFMDITGIPYDDLDCKTCHADNCKKCHEGKAGKKAADKDLCLGCHGREKSTFALDKANDCLDVHCEKGMICTDCHVGDEHDDVHGNEGEFKTMRDPGAVKAKCTNCHEENQEIRSHKVHKGKLDCSACHVKSSVACLNCHMDSFLETGSRKGNFILAKDWTILINYQGKVTAGNAMTLVHKDKKFIAYQPYHSHSVQKTAKDCKDCHGNEATQLIKAGKKVPMLKQEDGKIVNWQGVVPCAPDSLEWTYFNKDGDKWVPIVNDEKEVVQMVGYGEPLTEKQIKMMTAPLK
ncbi:MAG TPA: hypothetical protein PLN69_08290 [bacterium]|nr:hypothetical protein [bacterium]